MSARFRFTPSVLDGETLEALFVARHGILDAALDAVREAAAGDHRAHKLFIGPRGAGKTHLVALIHHRLSALRAGGVRVQASWLVEDPWDIGSYAEFLEAVLEARTYAAPVNGGDAEAQLLASVAADGPIVVLAENFDRILTAIGSDGQRRLRALLENSQPLLLMATATRLSDEVARQDEPFYGFFSVTHLEPFGVEDAAAMLIAQAKHEQNETQLELLERPEAARRLATIAHLAGGQPRVWALLGPALQTSGIEDLVANLLGRVDDLTPYYQEQLNHLSPQEARVVRRMAAHDRPLTVRGIAELAKLDQRSVGKTISDLRRRGWIKQYSSAITELADKRHSYYQLAEPLARLAFQVKESRGEPIQLVVEFIAGWHDVALLMDDDRPDVSTYLLAAQQSTQWAIFARSLADIDNVAQTSPAYAPMTVEPAAADMLLNLDEALDALDRGDPGPMLDQPAPVSHLVEHALYSSSIADVRLDVARLATAWRVDWRQRIDRSDLWGLGVRVTQESYFGTPATVRVVVEQLLDLLPPDDPIGFPARISLGLSLLAHSDTASGLQTIEQAVNDQERVMGVDDPSSVSDRRLSDRMYELFGQDD